MTDVAEFAQENLETVREHGAMSPRSKRAAVIVGVMAVVLAIANLNVHNAMKTVVTGEGKVGNERMHLAALDNHRETLANDKVLLDAIAAGSPQARSTVRETEAEQAVAIRGLEARERGAEVSLARLERQVEHADRQYEVLESAVGALQIGIVLASISIVAGVLWLLLAGSAAGLIGLALTIYGLYLL